MREEAMMGAIDIGGTKIAVGLVDGLGCVASKLECPTQPRRGFEDAFQRMGQMLRETMSRAGTRITGIGIGCTGPVDPFKGTVEQADLLFGGEGAKLVELLEEEIGVPAALENDADAAAMGEAAWGAGKSIFQSKNEPETEECFQYK